MSDPAPRKKKKSGEALWLMSFSDMTLSLMCFFVLLISMMKPDQQRFENVKDGVSEKKEQTRNLKTVSAEVNQVIKDKKLDQATQVTYAADGLRIEFKDGLLFESGSAASNKKFESITKEVIKTIASIDSKYHMTIEGHTDDVAIGQGSKFESNWELSAARGFALLRMFGILGVDEKRMSVAAYAHTRPKIPIDNLKGELLNKARAANRRVVIRIE